MFHVFTFLPHSDTNRQQVEKKRHIGNDVVVIIFKEKNASPFLPSLMASKFNHIFIIVTLEIIEGKSIFHVAVSSADGVPAFGPPLPDNGIFTDPASCRIFLLQKSKILSFLFLLF